MYKRAIVNALIKYANNGGDYLYYAWGAYNELNRLRKQVNTAESLMNMLGKADRLLTEDMYRREFIKWMTPKVSRPSQKNNIDTLPDLRPTAIADNIVTTINRDSSPPKITRRKFIVPWLDFLYNKKNNNNSAKPDTQPSTTNATKNTPKMSRRQFLMPLSSR